MVERSQCSLLSMFARLSSRTTLLCHPLSVFSCVDRCREVIGSSWQETQAWNIHGGNEAMYPRDRRTSRQFQRPCTLTVSCVPDTTVPLAGERAVAYSVWLRDPQTIRKTGKEIHFERQGQFQKEEDEQRTPHSHPWFSFFSAAKGHCCVVPSNLIHERQTVAKEDSGEEKGRWTTKGPCLLIQVVEIASQSSSSSSSESSEESSSSSSEPPAAKRAKFTDEIDFKRNSPSSCSLLSPRCWLCADCLQ